jgi:hypothetical protein
VRILLDECLPRKLKKSFTGHAVRTAPEMGWAGKTNGELLKLAANGFDALITADCNMSSHIQPAAIPLTVISLAAKSNRLEDLLPLMPRVLAHLSAGSARRIIRIRA